ncbi:uncharacterized protein [Macrobrachium rosenbergii]|uniref:uncharacterized protein n=1 Tax=Macrobrachium rosenbergii TaxID=79674 RepID=UPI0034D494C6
MSGVESTFNFLTMASDSLEDLSRVNAYHGVIVEDMLNESELDKATVEALESESRFFTNYDCHQYEDVSVELYHSLVEDALVLKSNFKRLSKNEQYLKLMDASFKEQEKLGIIERIDNLDEFLTRHPDHSFLPHMGVFNLSRETTKCRVVYLSNLYQEDKNAKKISHNMAIHSGPNLNQKLSSALIHLRFDKFLLVYDLSKAFNQIALNEVDSNRLLCLWFRNVERNDYSFVGFKNVRLPFGLRCAPTLLLLALYKILVVDAQEDEAYLQNLKALLYQNLYMDNGAVSMDTHDELVKAYLLLDSIFNPYQFHLQQLASNDEVLQREIDANQGSKTQGKVKLLGSVWDRLDDTLSTKPICLDESASTKRTILRSIASQYDLYNFNGPILNRSRMFMHGLQCRKDMGWDDLLPEKLQREWKNIVKQANASLPISIPRVVGSRNSRFKLIACCDASKSLFGVVVYIQDLVTNCLSFVCAKNRIVNVQLESKSIPSLEVHAIDLATQVVTEIYLDLTGPSCLKPINIEELEVFSDSLVALSWVSAYNVKFDKMQKRTPFVLNRVAHIAKLCEIHPVKFSFVSGSSNPADFITRCVSSRQLVKQIT